MADILFHNNENAAPYLKGRVWGIQKHACQLFNRFYREWIQLKHQLSMDMDGLRKILSGVFSQFKTVLESAIKKPTLAVLTTLIFLHGNKLPQDSSFVAR